jgi:hypothetical protein
MHIDWKNPPPYGVPERPWGVHAAWEHFKETTLVVEGVPTPEPLVEFARIAFYGACIALMGQLRANVETHEHDHEARMAVLDQIHRELAEFQAEIEGDVARMRAEGGGS